MEDSRDKLDFDTKVIHAGQEPEEITGSVIPPIFATSTYKQKSPGVHTGYEYARTQNPTREKLEACIAGIEKCKFGISFSSGLAAGASILDMLPANSHIIALDDLYGGSWRLFELVRKNSSGLKISYLDPNNLSKIEELLTQQTKLIWIESPSNPLLKITDLRFIANFAKSNNLISVVDNTFASPFLQNPCNFGIDLVLHSITKYISGHSDMVGGFVGTNNRELSEKLVFLQNAVGSILDPFSAFLALRGVKTLSVRMERHCYNAMLIAKWLETSFHISKVIYPGLSNHPQHSIALEQMPKGFGAMISIYLKGDFNKTKDFLEKLKIFTLAESLGGVESLIGHPVTMSHGTIPEELRMKYGITDNLVRISVGIEKIDDLIEDLDNAIQ